MNEGELIKKAKKGDVFAFESLITSHLEKIYNFAYFLVKNRDDAQDITQQALIKAYLSIKKFKGRSSFTTWLYRIISNTFQDELKKGYRKYETSEEYLLEDKKDNLEEYTEEKLIIRKAVYNLPSDLSMIIILKDFQGFSYEEISQILSIPIGTVKSRISRAREILQKNLKELF